MSRFWSETVKNLTPYVPGEQPKLSQLIKLNTNESPYGPSPKAIAAIAGANNDSLRLYPDPNSDSLKQAIASNYQVKANQVFVGNGSDEVLAHAFLALLKHEAPILFPDITYSFYPVYCNLYQVSFQNIPLTEDFSIEIDDYLSFNQGKNGGIIFPNPNAPTGKALTKAQIEKLLQGNKDSVVVIDEAYVDFGTDSAVSLVDQYANLLVVHTLSKSRALAGLRVGYAIGHPDLIEALERVKNSFNSYPIDKLAMAGAVASIEDKAYLQKISAAVIDTRKNLVADLDKLGFVTVPSAANFVFTKHPQKDAAEIAARLREKHIIVRHFKLPRIDQHLRITIGTNQECKALVQALKEIIV
ncbi:histidinol-phosphate transaminase [Polynucleobacter sp. MWH-Spelu-300-X4]|uniref:histidinol-phosphate transaminase n=1 Tax=Polynucleobacter sp. MWH-Spelu-300-X4 TaxID=2689109 RepID=UPI001BFD551B|nr:histidinol-phosphate transaminase [Polynucleobacter sp. MWH-Spelu-300-X4]QWD79861.1 histidinol-phosphate transaminase [Polynucleobacter sp. MWH-Spelu-300-X4]